MGAYCDKLFFYVGHSLENRSAIPMLETFTEFLGTADLVATDFNPLLSDAAHNRATTTQARFVDGTHV